MNAPNFWQWLEQQESREDSIGAYARRMHNVLEDGEGLRIIPTGFSSHAKAAAAEFAVVRDAKKPAAAS